MDSGTGDVAGMVELNKKEVIMPGGDRKGPMGEGPMTGRGLGLCAGNDTPGSATEINQGRGMGRGFGRGMGRGFGRANRHGQPRGWGFRFRMRDLYTEQEAPREQIKSNKVKKKKKSK